MTAVARISVALAAVFVAAACSGEVRVPPTGAPSERPRAGGRFVIASHEDITTLQPILAGSASSTITTQIAGLVYEPLARSDPHTGEWKSNLAKWTVSSDGRAYSAEIAPNANWSDGRPIVGEDWLTHIKGVARSKKTPGAAAFPDVVGFVEYAEGRATTIAGITTDGKRMTLAFKTVRCTRTPFGSSPIPTHHFGKYLDDRDTTRNFDDVQENTAPPVASGPFVLAEWRKGDSVLLKRNPAYWKGAPLLEQIEVRVVGTRTRVIDELRAGRVHLDSDVPVADVAALERSGLKIQKHQHNGYTYLGWNLRRADASGLRDRRIRQALAYGLDTDAVIRSVLDGQGTKMFAHHPPVSSWALPSGLNEYRYDPARAEELIRAAGYTKGSDGLYQRDGRVLSLTAVTNPDREFGRELFVQLAADQYRSIGVRLELRPVPFLEMVERLYGADLAADAYVIAWTLGQEPYDIWHSNRIPVPGTRRPANFNNLGAFSHPAVDAALDRALFGPDCSAAARSSAYHVLNRILNEEQPYNFGYSKYVFVAHAAQLMGVEAGTFAYTIGQMHNIEKWWFKR